MKNMKKNVRYYFDNNKDIIYSTILILSVSIIIFRKIIFSDGYMIYGDMSSSYSLDQFLNLVFRPGSINILPELVLRLPFFLLGKLFGIDSSLINKLLSVFILFLSSFFIIVAVKRFINFLDNHQNKKTDFTYILAIVGIGFIFNIWTTFYVLMHPWLVLSITAVPLFIIYFYELIKENKIDAYRCGNLSILFAIISTQIHSLIILIISISIIFFLCIIYKKISIQFVKTFLGISIIIILANSWFVLPMTYTVLVGITNPSTIKSNYQLTDNEWNWLNQNVDPLNFLKFEQQWYKNIDYSLKSPILDNLRRIFEYIQAGIYFFSILSIILIKNRYNNRYNFKDRNNKILLISFILILLLFAIISSGILKGFLENYLDLGFIWILRNLDKFTGVVLSISSIFFGLNMTLIKEYNTRIFKIIFFGIIIIFLFVNWPMLTGNFNGELNNYKIPQEYNMIKEKVGNDNNILIIPSSNFAIPTGVNMRYHAMNNPLLYYLNGRYMTLYTEPFDTNNYFDYPIYDYIVINLDQKDEDWRSYSQKMLNKFLESDYYRLIWNNNKFYIFKNSLFNFKLYNVANYSNIDNNLLSTDFNYNDLHDYFITKSNEFNYETFGGMLHMSTTSKKGWSNMTTVPISVGPEDIIKISSLQRQDTPSYMTHIAIDSFSSDKWKRSSYCSGADGRYDWIEFKCRFIVPDNTSKIRLILNAGSAYGKYSSTWIKSLSVDHVGNMAKNNYNLNYAIFNAMSYDMSYRIKFNSTKQFMLALTDDFDPLWVANVYENGDFKNRIIPVPLYETINGFLISSKGDLDIIVEYEPYKLFEIGSIISITFISAIIAIIIAERKKIYENK